jgi:hypothetical protein
VLQTVTPHFPITHVWELAPLTDTAGLLFSALPLGAIGVSYAAAANLPPSHYGRLETAPRAHPTRAGLFF